MPRMRDAGGEVCVPIAYSTKTEAMQFPSRWHDRFMTWIKTRCHSAVSCLLSMHDYSQRGFRPGERTKTLSQDPHINLRNDHGRHLGNACTGRGPFTCQRPHVKGKLRRRLDLMTWQISSTPSSTRREHNCSSDADLLSHANTGSTYIVFHHPCVNPSFLQLS